LFAYSIIHDSIKGDTTNMSTTQTKVPAGTWNLDPVHSAVGFEVDYLAGTFRGQFRDVQAELGIGDSGARIEGTADVSSVDVKDENLVAHLQSPDFFDAERYPELRFVADDVDLDGESVVVPGEITIKGVTKPVEVTGTLTEPIQDAWGNDRLGLQLSATVDRTEFGLDWNMPLPTGDQALANTVTILAELQLVKAA
jgi:polyisoprenoid-binding protein YceI